MRLLSLNKGALCYRASGSKQWCAAHKDALETSALVFYTGLSINVTECIQTRAVVKVICKCCWIRPSNISLFMKLRRLDAVRIKKKQVCVLNRCETVPCDNWLLYSERYNKLWFDSWEKAISSPHQLFLLRFRVCERIQIGVAKSKQKS